MGFLTSDKIPTGFRDWAHRQVDMLDAYMASASALESDDGDEGDDREEEPVPPAVVMRKKAPRAAKTGRRRRRKTELRQRTPQLPAHAAKLIMGVAIGIVALGAIFGVRVLTKDSPGAPPATADAPAFDQARASELEELLQQDPTNQDALLEIGEMNFQAARNEDTIVWFSKLVELDPRNTHAATDLGTANFNLGNADLAKEWWRKVLAVDPNDVQAHHNMGFAYANAEPRDLAAAVSEWEAVLRLAPESQLAQTVKVRLESLKAELKSTPPAPPTAATPTAAAAAE